MTEEKTEKIEIKAEEKAEKSEKPSWVKMKSAELEKIVVELAKEGKSPAQIGLTLRDKYGIPKAKLLGKKVTQILDEKGIEWKRDKYFFEKKVENLKKHIGRNKHDYSASRSLTKTLWGINKIERLEKSAN